MNKNEYIDRAKKLIEEHGIIDLICYVNFDGENICEPYPIDGVLVDVSAEEVLIELRDSPLELGSTIHLSFL